MSENSYIFRRRIKAFGNTLLFVFCRILPIQKNKIAICTFEGKSGFGCNPKYIVEELHRRNPDYQFVWFVNDDKKDFPAYVQKIRNTFWNRARHLSTSKIWIDNYRKPYGTIKRKGQYYFQTWHATIAFKSIGLWRKDAFSKMAYLVSKNDSDMIDFVITDSEWCDEIYPKGMVYNGEFLRLGAPRCDILFGDKAKQRRKIRSNYGLEEDSKIVMYAPTFRESAKNGKRSVNFEKSTLDFSRLLSTLDRRFGGKWNLCIKMHPQIAAQMKYKLDETSAGRIFDVSTADDMCELLAGVDAFITDYSSAAMDASFANIPVFLYADDLEQYISARGSMLWNFSSDSYAVVTNNKEMTPGMDVILPYPMAQTNDELEKNILRFDAEEYQDKMKRFAEKVQLVFDGKASVRAADIVEAYIRKG